MVHDSFGPSSKQTSVIYCRLTDFGAIVGVDPVLIRKGNGSRQEMLLQSQEISVKEERLPRSLMTAPTKFKLVEGGNFQKAASSQMLLLPLLP